MVTSIFASPGFGLCGCCEELVCPPLVTEYQIREEFADIYGYPGFETALTYFRTAVSRGWSGQHGSALIVKNSVSCSYLPLGRSQWGYCNSRGYMGNPSFPPGSAYIVTGSDSCDDGFLSFYDFPWHNSVSNTAIRGVDLYDADTGLVMVVSGGPENLLNEFAMATVFSEVKAAARAIAWTGVGGGASLSNFGANAQYREHLDGTEDGLLGLTLRLMRYRFKFKPPDTGGYRVNWTVTWTPFVWDSDLNDLRDGTPEIFDDENEWRWDEETPGDYDPEDEDTWPTSPWFEMPEPTENGKYRVSVFERTCDEADAPVAPASVTGFAS